ncbi:DUF4747 family protein [Pseudomonas syringae]|uniref:DUF4747 family protein n=1 Tax=Pseudomonas syringae TaxID=317 RepID=UPI00070C5C50|nr:DUF4747 family protein [Pseudomonas syringae]
MASYIVFNIQLLPANSKKNKEVGNFGYKKLFEGLSISTIQAFKKKNINVISYPLANDTFFAPASNIIADDHAYGQFLKYDRSDTVDDLYTNKQLFQASPGTFPVANRFSFDYVFDYETHRLAVAELSGRLPKPSVCNDAILSFLSPVAASLFPSYVLTVNIVSDPTELQSVLASAEGFKSVSATLTFPNGHKLGRQLQELKDNNVHHLKVEASTESKDSVMPNLPEFLREIVEASTDYGKTSIAYIKEEGGRLCRYITSKYPLKIQLRMKKGEQPAEMRRRVMQAVRSLRDPDAEEHDNV